MVASKVHDDIYYSNKYWGMIGELSTSEMSSLELQFLSLLSFECFVSREEYDTFLDRIAGCEHLFSLGESHTNFSTMPRPPSRSASFAFSPPMSHNDTAAALPAKRVAPPSPSSWTFEYDTLRSDHVDERVGRRSLMLKAEVEASSRGGVVNNLQKVLQHSKSFSCWGPADYDRVGVWKASDSTGL
jgi:hypothetical protein